MQRINSFFESNGQPAGMIPAPDYCHLPECKSSREPAVLEALATLLVVNLSRKIMKKSTASPARSLHSTIFSPHFGQLEKEECPFLMC
jgi:hypothetical protein